MLGVTLTDFPRYRTLAEKISWFQPVAKFAYFWVQETGKVVVAWKIYPLLIWAVSPYRIKTTNPPCFVQQISQTKKPQTCRSTVSFR